MNRFLLTADKNRWQNRILPGLGILLGCLLLALLLSQATRTVRAQESVPTGRGFSMPVIQPHAVDDPNAFIYKVRLGEYWILIARKFGVTYDELRAANPELWALRGELIWPGDEMSIPGLTAADQRATEEYTVQPGDSWYRIADKFGVSYWDLRLDNLGLWRRRGIVIRPGDQMQVVGPNPVAVQPIAETVDTATAGTTVAQPAVVAPTATPAAAPATAPEAAATPTPAPVQAPPPVPGTLPSVDSSPPFLVTNPPADATTYTVRPGDSWFAIANRYGMTFEKLRSANPELWALRGQNIRPADQMVIPAHGSPPPPMEIRTAPDKDDTSAPADGSYTVVAGDTWTSVAVQLGMTEEALKTANIELSSRELAPGDMLRVP